jgi:hypothetical protein
MNPNDVAPMVVGVVFFVMSGVVLLLRPIATRLGKYLEVLAEERRRQLAATPVNRDDAARIATLLESMDQRLAQLEDRQEFTDKLLGSRSTSDV